MSQTQSSPTVAPTHRMVIPWGRVRGLRRRLTQTVFALLPLILLAIGVYPAIAVIPAIYPFFILLRRGFRRPRTGVTRTALTRQHRIRHALSLLPRSRGARV